MSNPEISPANDPAQATPELLPCPFYGTIPQIIKRGNEHTKQRSVTLWCAECRVERTDAGLILTFKELLAIATKNWNQRTLERDLAAARLEVEVNKTEANKLLNALIYVDRQVREVWKPEDTYQMTHHGWAVDIAHTALTGGKGAGR